MSWRCLVFLGICALLFLAVLLGAAAPGEEAGEAAMKGSSTAWWVWAMILFVFALVIGIIAPLSGTGGGVMFVSLGMAFFPFSADFIRGAGLIIPLTTALSSAPKFIDKGLANIKVMAPVVCISMVTSMLGGVFGLWITSAFPAGRHYIGIALGVVLIVVFAVMLSSKSVEFPEVKKQDSISKALGLEGSWYEVTLNRVVNYKITNLPVGVVLFSIVGFVAGMFGLGAGWANVPVLNLLMGAPIKVAAATSMVIITVNDSAAAWIYIANGAVLPMIVVPSVLGISIGARLGATLAVRTKPTMVKYLVMGIMLFAAILNVFEGLNGLHVF